MKLLNTVLPFVLPLTQALSLDFSKNLPPTDTKPIPGGSPMMNCDASKPQLLDITSLLITPNPPVRGAPMVLQAAGHISDVIPEGSYVDVDLRLGYIKLLTQRLDLCAILADHARDDPDMQCPVQPGDHKFSQTIDVPNEVPPGRYDVIAKAYTKDGVLVTCLSGSINFPNNFF